MTHLTLFSSGPRPEAEEPLDAYSRVVAEDAERPTPSFANLRSEDLIGGSEPG
jgi:hypothetical protein